MKILFGVQGTGNGHLSRARAMGESLAAADVDVDYLFSGRQREKFFDMELFGDFQVKEGLTFMTDNGRVQYLKTAANSKPLRFFNDIRQLNLEPYEENRGSRHCLTSSQGPLTCSGGSKYV